MTQPQQPQLPEAMQYRPSAEFQKALHNLNTGLVEAGKMAGQPITAQNALKEVTIPLFNLLSNYIRTSQQDTYGYFYGLCTFLYHSQQAAADDNIILAVDPDLADEVIKVVDGVREDIQSAKDYLDQVQEFLSSNKPAKYEVAEGEDEDPAAKDKAEANLEKWQSLREEAVRVQSTLQESYEDLDTMADNVNSAVYDPESETGDEVALPQGEEPAEEEEYESVVG